MTEVLECLRSEIAALEAVRHFGRIQGCAHGLVQVHGLSHLARIGDRLRLRRADGSELDAEVLKLSRECVSVLPDGVSDGIAIGGRAELLGRLEPAPDDNWIGRVVDPFGRALDGRPLGRGPVSRALRAEPPPAAERRRLGARLETGLAAFNTVLPLVRGQRLGLFAGAGVGKSSLLADFARGVAADVVVIGLIGERGRELREFTEEVLGPEGMRRAVVVAATSDRSPLVRRRAGWTTLAVAEHFRDAGAHVLLLMDSVTRFAEAHREIALAGGEAASMRGFPPSTAQMIMSLAERAGPGPEGAGDITAIFSVLVAGSDLDEPVADILRGVLDGHVVLDRAIAERGRFPPVDLLKSVSRSLPGAVSNEENAMIGRVRTLLGAYERAELMVQAGLYQPGSDPLVDQAITAWPEIEAFLALREADGTGASFARLEAVLEKSAGTFRS